MQRPFLSVVVPAYNEARRLPNNLHKIIDFLRTQPYLYEVLVVDDGSTDDTVALCREVAAGDNRVRIIENPHYGKGYTVRTGMLSATGEIVLFSDADLAVPIDDINLLLPYFEQGYDVVFGSREGGGPDQRVDEPWYRHLMGRVFNTAVQVIAIPGVHDTQCGFKALRYEVAQRVFPQMLIHDGSQGPIKGPLVTGFDVEMLFLANKMGYRLKEVPVRWFYGKESKVNPARDSWLLFKELILVRLNDMRGKYHPQPAPVSLSKESDANTASHS